MNNIASLIDDGCCFGCGKSNTTGLQLDFEWSDGRYRTFWTPQQKFQGWVGRAHGGIIAVVLDEILSRVVLTSMGMNWVTAELTTRFIRPAEVGVELIGEAWIERAANRLTLTRGELRIKETGVLVAEGTAKLMPTLL